MPLDKKFQVRTPVQWNIVIHNIICSYRLWRRYTHLVYLVYENRMEKYEMDYENGFVVAFFKNTTQILRRKQCVLSSWMSTRRHCPPSYRAKKKNLEKHNRQISRVRPDCHFVLYQLIYVHTYVYFMYVHGWLLLDARIYFEKKNCI